MNKTGKIKGDHYYLLGLIIGVFPIFVGIVLFQANSENQCSYAWMPDNSGCLFGSIIFIIFGCLVSLGFTIYYYKKDRKALHNSGGVHNE